MLALLLFDLLQQVLGEHDDRPVRSADVFKDLCEGVVTILLMGYLVMLKIDSSLSEFLRYF